MNYLYKYLKYKNKYLFLKNQHSGSVFSNLQLSSIETFLMSKGIDNFSDTVPKKLLDQPFLQNNSRYFNLSTWNAIIKFNQTLRRSQEFDLRTNINRYFDTLSDVVPIAKLPENLTDVVPIAKLPEIIIPTENLTFTFPYSNIDDFDLSVQTSVYDERIGSREYEFKFTHLLLEKHPRNGYVLSALLYYTPDITNKENIRQILKKYYTKEIDDCIDEENVSLLTNKLKQIESSDFLTTPKYVRVGQLYFYKVAPTSIIIDHIDAWIMKPGSGLQMICSLLTIFLPGFNTIHLTPGSIAVTKY